MKTFETEKGNIPEGATHYLEATDSLNFAWWNSRENTLLFPENSGEWQPALSSDNVYNPIPIPQAKEVEWVNGELLEFNGEPCIFIGMSEGFPVVKYTNDADSTLAGEIDEIFATDMLSKPETEAERVERERLESGKALHSQASKTEVATEFGIFRLWEMEDKETRDHYCQLAERINYRKESE